MALRFRGWIGLDISLPPAFREMRRTLRDGSVWNDTMMLFLTSLHGSIALHN
jgi:hypothetical protein